MIIWSHFHVTVAVKNSAVCLICENIKEMFAVAQIQKQILQ